MDGPLVRARAARVARGVTVLAVLAVSSWPSAASAHVGGPTASDAPYYQTLLTGISPVPAGVSAQVASNGDWIELTANGPAEVVISGYGGEPYLRIAASGVWQNDLSATTYLNQSLFVDAAALNHAPGSAVPAWRRISQGGTARWHDHRIHWMGVGRPANVVSDPAHLHLIGSWAIPARAGQEPFMIRGTLNWTGKPNQLLGIPTSTAVPLLAAAGILIAITITTSRTGRRLSRRRSTPARRPEHPDSAPRIRRLLDRSRIGAVPVSARRGAVVAESVLVGMGGWSFGLDACCVHDWYRLAIDGSYVLNAAGDAEP